MVIELTDHKGDFWMLILYMYTTRKNKNTGLYECWGHVLKQSNPNFQSYRRIPIPIFTEWWPK